MKIAVFTSNQPRHLALIKELSKIADEVYAVIEVNTVFPGQRADFYQKTEIMQAYFAQVIASEQNIFGNISFLPLNVFPLIIKSGDLNDLSPAILAPVLGADRFVVFGASYIKGYLIDELVARGAYNIHMGISPYYRGSSCNFWASYDKNYALVGATIHMLSKGLDSGPMLFHALPTPTKHAFDLGMQAVKSAHTALVQRIADGSIDTFKPVLQDKSKEIRYTKNADFTDSVAAEYLANPPSAKAIADSIANQNSDFFINPFYF